MPLIKPFRSHSKSMILRIILSFYIVFVNSFERTYEKLLAAERRLKAETSEPIFSCMKFTGGEHILKHNFYTNKFDTSGNILVPKCLCIKISHNPNSILRQLGTTTMPSRVLLHHLAWRTTAAPGRDCSSRGERRCGWSPSPRWTRRWTRDRHLARDECTSSRTCQLKTVKKIFETHSLPLPAHK